MTAYSVAVIDVHDSEKYAADYVPQAVRLYEAAGGKVLARGGNTIGSDAPKGRVVIIEFPSLEAIENMVASPEWLRIQVVGEKYATIKAYGIEGV
jgi:uncharacterized protein (DUF1330 family)